MLPILTVYTFTLFINTYTVEILATKMSKFKLIEPFPFKSSNNTLSASMKIIKNS